MKKYIYILSIVALGLPACNRFEIQTPVEDVTIGSKVYRVSIPALMGTDTKAMSFDNSGATPTCTSTFATSELVYVYNNNKGALLGGTLSPTNLSNGGKVCELTGDLTGTIEPGDELTLYYNAVDLGSDLMFLYTIQNGTAEGVLDGATASVTVSSTSPSLSTTSAHFSNLASMFRFKFKDETEAPIEVHALTVCSKNISLIGQYMPLAIPEQQYARGCVPIRIASPTTDYLYMSLFFDESPSNNSDALTFVAEDNSYLYLGDKTAPSVGFKNGKYYYNTAAIQLTKVGALQAPTITWNNPNVDIPALAFHDYSILTDDIDIELTGTSLGYYFQMEDHNTSSISFNNLTAAKYDMPFVGNHVGSMTLTISGDNSIDCRFVNYGILADQTLKLQGSGTLTVTTNLSEMCGLLGASNYNPINNDTTTTGELDVSTQLAATGYTVTRSARTDNADGTYTWTYTVAPAGPAGPPSGAIDGLFTINAGGDKVYFSQGNLKYSSGTWSFHTHQYDMCFTSTGDVSGNYDALGTFDLFGFGTSGYNDKYPYMTSMYDDYYQGDIAGTEYDWGTNAISNGGNTANSGWRTLTQSEWSYLLNFRSTTSGVRYAKATVNGVAGLIILPDDWSASYFDLSSVANDDSKFFSTIQFDQSVWENTFEAHGAVFLPVFGFRDEATINNAGGFLSYYWSSTYQGYDSGPNAYCAYYLTLGEYYDDYYQSGVNYVATNTYGPVFAGAFVRLVKDAN